MKRRDFLATLSALGTAAAGGLSLSACDNKTGNVIPAGSFNGPHPERGHLLREGKFPPISETRRHAVAIVGGGVAGLSAAWRLQRAGLTDFALYELEDSVGGNARWSENESTRFPLGAHYLPLPPREARAVRMLLADIGMLKGDPDAEKPEYDERYLCFAPQERLYRNGAWQEGIIPASGLSADEQRQTVAFLEQMNRFKRLRGRDGRRAFAVPMALSSRDPGLLALDKISMRQWMLDAGYTAPSLHWYTDYACRDDFGTHAAQTSAWAGIHYFACRGGNENDAASDIVLTAPEGNGWLIERLAARLRPHLHANALATRIGHTERGDCYVHLYLVDEKRSIRIEAPQLICATPTFILPHIWPDMPAKLLEAVSEIEHAPWLVANLHIRAMPEERRGAPMAWDNVLYESAALGYVVATHQTLRTRPDASVLTYYQAFAGTDSVAERRHLLATSREFWAEQILGELSRVHPNIRELVTRLDIARYGHAMAKPKVGRLWHSRREQLHRSINGIQLAHADLSGFSIFEEANYHGVRCAEHALHAIGRTTSTLL